MNDKPKFFKTVLMTIGGLFSMFGCISAIKLIKLAAALACVAPEIKRLAYISPIFMIGGTVLLVIAFSSKGCCCSSKSE